jgi:hypothetical protein
MCDGQSVLSVVGCGQCGQETDQVSQFTLTTQNRLSFHFICSLLFAVCCVSPSTSIGVLTHRMAPLTSFQADFNEEEPPSLVSLCH